MKLSIIFITLLLFTGISLYAQLPNINLTQVASGLTRPVLVTHCGDDRLFIVEQNGRIDVMQPGSSSYTTFLDIISIVNDAGNEQGLLGLAFHPDYQNNGYFYVNYTTGSGAGYSVVERYTVSADSNVADENSGVTLFTVTQPYSNHNGGCMAFGADGYLYIGFGDGGSGNDPDGNAQDLTTKLGKMLRIDVNNSDEPYYSVPSTNPFYNNPNADSTIWDYGLRNPWRFSFDRLTGDMWIGDVGQSGWEEVDFQVANDTGGHNYGWKCWEGNHQVNGTSGCPADSVVTFPVHEYSHSGGECSVSGGYVYRGSSIPLLYGKYVFADYCTSKMRMLSDSAGTWLVDQIYDASNYEISSFGEDLAGEMYVCFLGSGTIQKITNADCVPANIEWNIPYTDSGSICVATPLIFSATPSGGTFSSSAGTFDGDTLTLSTIGNVTIYYTYTDGSCSTVDSVPLSGVCSTPVSVSVSNITTTKATVSWITNDCAKKYRLQIRQQGTATWTTYFVNSIYNSRVVKFLQPGTTYQVRVRTQCSINGSILSSWSPIINFTTLGACTSPTNISATPSNTSSLINWTAGSGVYAYRLRYRVQGSGTWIPIWINGSLTSKNITGLTSNTTYEYQMRSQCNAQGTDFSSYTPIQTFTTQMRLGENENDASTSSAQALVGIYPNPNNGSFALSFVSSSKENLQLSVYDILGREVFYQVVYSNSGQNIVNLNIDLTEGLYFLKLEGTMVNKVLRFNVNQ